ncbi:MAG: site-specific integrase [Pirellulaceae bacterium]
MLGEFIVAPIPNAVSIVDTKCSASQTPEIILAAGHGAQFAWDEFFNAKIRNPHTRRAYRRIVYRFLTCCDATGIKLQQITPADVAKHIDGQQIATTSKNQILSALRHFFDCMVVRHAVALNPAATVRGERHSVVEGKTPEITVRWARQLLESICIENLVGLRDKSIIAILIYTAARVGAAARLQVCDFYDAGDQYFLHMTDKGSKSREIPVRHDLQRLILEYLFERKIDMRYQIKQPLFPTVIGRTQRLTLRAMTADDIARMLKRRLRNAGLPDVTETEKTANFSGGDTARRVGRNSYFSSYFSCYLTKK